MSSSFGVCEKSTIVNLSCSVSELLIAYSLRISDNNFAKFLEQVEIMTVERVGEIE